MSGRIHAWALAMLAALSAPAMWTHAQTPPGSAFTYQGRLDDNGAPANGPFDARFTLFDAAAGGAQVGPTVCADGIPLVEGLFTASLDFGAAAFAGGARWLEIAARPDAVPGNCGQGSFTLLSPRQALTAAPYALQTRGLNVDAAGRVGIGTTAPPSTLLSFGTSSPGAVPTIAVHENLGTNYYGIGSTIPEATLDFWAGGGRHLVLNYAGQVGIGTLPVNARLHVAGNAKINGQNELEFGAGVQKQAAAGRIAYQQYSSGLDIVGAGLTVPERRVTIWAEGGCTIQGPCSMTKAIIYGGADVAENYDVAPARTGESAPTAPRPGMVVVIDPDAAGKLMVSDHEYDRRVAGVISGADGVRPGLVLGQTGTVADGEWPVANVGRVWCLCDASASPIGPGDLLVSSSTPGHAQRADDAARRQGAVLGKAMSRLDSGTGLVLVLVSLQ